MKILHSQRDFHASHLRSIQLPIKKPMNPPMNPDIIDKPTACKNENINKPQPKPKTLPSTLKIIMPMQPSGRSCFFCDISLSYLKHHPTIVQMPNDVPYELDLRFLNYDRECHQSLKSIHPIDVQFLQSQPLR